MTTLQDVPSHNVNNLKQMEKSKEELMEIILRENAKWGISKKARKRKSSFARSVAKGAKTLAAAGLTALLLSPQDYSILKITEYKNFSENASGYFENANAQSIQNDSNPEFSYQFSNPDFPVAMIPQIPSTQQGELKKDLRDAAKNARRVLTNYAIKTKQSAADFFYNFGNLESVVLNEQKTNIYDAAFEKSGEAIEEEQKDENILEEFITGGKKNVNPEQEEIDYSSYLEHPYEFDETKVFSLAKAMQENPKGVIGTLIAKEIKKFDDIKENRGRIISLEKTIAKASSEIPEVKYILLQNGIKEEIAILPFTESRWEKDAESPKLAVGLWQFMEETAQRYGLKIEKEIMGYDAEGKKIGRIIYDERLNPILSTKAAAKYLSDLEKTLCNTDLAIKAFNGGSGKFKPFVDKNNCENISLIDFFAFRGKKIEDWYTNVKVGEGYTLTNIMEKRGIPGKNRYEIMKLNGIKNPDKLKVGQILHIPFEFAEKFRAKTPGTILENVEYIAKHKAMMHVLKTNYPEFYSIKPSNGFGAHMVTYKPLEHVVSRGEYPWKIAERYVGGGHKGYKELIKNIKLINKGFSTGQKLQIPSSTTLMEFALYNGHNLKNLMKLNPQIPDIYMQLPNGAKIVYPLQQERAQQI